MNLTTHVDDLTLFGDYNNIMKQWVKLQSVLQIYKLSLVNGHAYGAIKGVFTENHHAIPFSNNHNDTATKATDEQNGWNEIKSKKNVETQIEKNERITIKIDSPLLTCFPRHATWQYTHFQKRQDSTTTAYEKIRHMSYQNPILLVGEAVACRLPGEIVNKLESAWLESICWA